MNQHAGAERANPGRTTFAALMIGQAAQGLAFTAISPSLAAIAKDYDATGNGMIIAQQMLTVASAGVILAAFISGQIVARFGTLRTMLVSLACFGLFGSGGLFLHDVWLLLAARVIVGFSAACLTTACLSAIALLYQGGARATAIGASAAIGSIVSLVGFIAGGALAQAHGWRIAFIQYPVFGFLGLLLCIVGLRRTEVKSEAVAVALAATGGRLWPLYLFTIVISIVIFMGSTQLGFLLPQDGVTSPTRIGLIMSALTGFSAIAAFFFGMIERRIGMQGALIAGLVCAAAGLALIGGLFNPLAAIAGVALMGVFVGITMPYVVHAIATKAPSHARPQALGLINAAVFAGAFVNPLVCAPISNLLGLHGLFLAAGLVMALLAVSAAMKRAPAMAC